MPIYHSMCYALFGSLEEAPDLSEDQDLGRLHTWVSDRSDINE